MIVVALTGLASFGLFVLAALFAARAAAKPPMAIRTESRRSQAEYDFNRAAAGLRQRGYACLLTGALLLVVCLTMTILSAFGNG